MFLPILRMALAAYNELATFEEGEVEAYQPLFDKLTFPTGGLGLVIGGGGSGKSRWAEDLACHFKTMKYPPRRGPLTVRRLFTLRLYLSAMIRRALGVSPVIGAKEQEKDLRRSNFPFAGKHQIDIVHAALWSSGVA